MTRNGFINQEIDNKSDNRPLNKIDTALEERSIGDRNIERVVRKKERGIVIKVLECEEVDSSREKSGMLAAVGNH